MRRQIEDLKRKADQGSQQLQGEAGEDALESILRSHFPSDDISAIGQGVRGADIHQVIVDPRGGRPGSILWECKNARNWSDGWIAKLKDGPAGAARRRRRPGHHGAAEGLPPLHDDRRRARHRLCVRRRAGRRPARSAHRARAGAPRRDPQARHAGVALSLSLRRRIPPARRGRRRCLCEDAGGTRPGASRRRTHVRPPREADRRGHASTCQGCMATCRGCCRRCRTCAPWPRQPRTRPDSQPGLADSHCSRPRIAGQTPYNPAHERTRCPDDTCRHRLDRCRAAGAAGARAGAGTARRRQSETRARSSRKRSRTSRAARSSRSRWSTRSSATANWASRSSKPTATWSTS